MCNFVVEWHANSSSGNNMDDIPNTPRGGRSSQTPPLCQEQHWGVTYILILALFTHHRLVFVLLDSGELSPGVGCHANTTCHAPKYHSVSVPFCIPFRVLEQPLLYKLNHYLMSISPLIPSGTVVVVAN